MTKRKTEKEKTREDKLLRLIQDLNIRLMNEGLTYADALLLAQQIILDTTIKMTIMKLKEMGVLK